uniref:Uncharacterized mitochondrial protein AtMg00810-like n=1 Tax=Tanacetum cinerariifolium TaxID=118510 RepID=A0A6L2LLQ5_TANCI|nr:uncharacterized mitochondrial protein AtMg00810-like [Tanacetum cinerariifolium]
MLRDNALLDLRKKFKKAEQERDDLKLKLDKFQTSSKNLSQLLASQTSNKTRLGYDNQVFTSSVFDSDEIFSSESNVSMTTSPVYHRYKSGEGYHVVPPPYTGIFMPSKPNLVFHDAPTVNETVPTAFNIEPSTTKPIQDLSQSNRPSALIIKDWVSDSEDDSEVENPILPDNLKTDISKSKGHRNNRNRKACFVCKSLTHLIKDCDYYEKKMVQKLIRNYALRGNHQHYARMTHPNPQRDVVPTSVLTRSRLILLTVARPVNTAVPQTKVHHQRPTKHGVNKIHLPLRRPINLRPSSQASNFTQKVTTTKSPQLPDENHVLLSVLRENNMYNVDLKNIVPSGDLTCLFAKAALDESNLWHKRIGHINFKTMNKLVKDSSRPIPFWAEVVNTACYVQNRVLVTKPQNKIPYELLLGRTPGIGFMRPFGYPVTIHNTLDPLGKFDRKADEGFLVGYSVSRSRPTWLFDIDTLTKSMNYQPVITGNQPNSSTDHQNTNDDATFEVKEPKFEVKKPESQVHVSPSSSVKTKKRDDKTTRESKGKSLVEFATGPSNTTVSLTIGKSSYVDPSQYPDDPNMPALEDITYSDDKEDVGFEDLDYPNKLYKVVKALYGLHQAPRAWYETLANYLLENGFHRGQIDQTLFIKKKKGDILLVHVYVDDIIFGSTNKDFKAEARWIFISQDKYVAEILRKFGLTIKKLASTPIDTEKPLLKDPDGEDVDVHTYMSMIGSLMYLTSSRQDIMFDVCACAPFQVTPKASHLHAFKRIFRYLKGKPHLGLWYPKDSPFNLVSYSNSDYAGASLDRKSKT